jgi:DNA-binding transcriptional regulator YhcF (GntR family)
MNKWKIELELKSQMPLYKQIVASVINAVEKGNLQKDDILPSINEFSATHEVARDTIEKAYKELKERAVIKSVKGKGYFIVGVKGSKLRILLIMNKLSAYKKIIYYSFISALGDHGVVELQIHHGNLSLFKKLLDENLGKYHYYVVMPHFYDASNNEAIVAEIERIPKDELVLLDKDIDTISGKYLCVYQDFKNDIYDALSGAISLIQKYQKIELVFPFEGHYPPEIIVGFRNFCKHNNLLYEVHENMDEVNITKGTLYVVIAETDLVSVVKKATVQKYIPGIDFGIISFNETVLKEILAGGITTISTHFDTMGSIAASLILAKHAIKVRNPFSLIRRNSLQ